MTRTSCPCLTHSLAKEWQTFVLFNIFSPGSEYNVDKSSIFIKNYPPINIGFIRACRKPRIGKLNPLGTKL